LSSKYDKIGNYNLSYELLKEAVREFDGYILGLSQNDIWLFSDSLEPFKRRSNRKIEITEDEELIKFLTELAPRVLDRTTGSYFFINLLNADKISTMVNHIGFDNKKSRELMTLVPGYYPQNLGGLSGFQAAIFGLLGKANGFVAAMRGFNPSEDILTLNTLTNVSNELGSEDAELISEIGTEISAANQQRFSAIQGLSDATGKSIVAVVDGKSGDVFQAQDIKSKLQTINDCLYYYDVLGIEKKEIQKEVKDSKTGKITLETQYKDQSAEDKKNKVPKEPRMFSADVKIDSSFLNAPEINKYSNGIPDRYKSPGLGALVMQHPKASNASKGKDHLPIFFNAIPPIEMSRCTPYLDVRVLTENYAIDSNGNKSRPSKLNSVAYMRFMSEAETGKFVLNESIGFGDLKPVSTSVNQDERKATENIDIAYMDIFTTPQTFSNANINASNPTANDQGGGLFLSAISGQVNDDPILEPIMPFLSLENLTVSITGAGYGIMASKSASLKLTLHDRSRLRDLAPLVSSSQFATTKILIEYGWNHPEGGPNSDNVIGKYLNALKDRSVYQVTGCDYDFSDGGNVGISIKLAAYGFRQTERVHCGAGPEVPLNVFSEYIEKVNDDLKRNAENIAGSSKAKAPEVRQKIKLNERASRSTSNSLSWAAYREIMSALRSHDQSAINAIKYIFELESITDVKEKINRRKQIDIELLVDDSNVGSNIFQRLEEAGLFGENKKETMLQRVYGKIKALENINVSDPFISSLVYGAKIPDGDKALDTFDITNFFTLGASQQKQFLNELGRSDGDVSLVTLGKVIANFIGYPLAATCLYDEVQLIFYPLNHQCGGGRIHTTASFPIPISRIREEVQNAAKSSANISVKRMFSLIEKIVKDRNLDVYGISDVYSEKSDFSEKTEDQQLLAMIGNLTSNGHSFGFNPQVLVSKDQSAGGAFEQKQREDLNNVSKGNQKLKDKAYNVDYLISLVIEENIRINYSNEESLKSGDLSKGGRFKGELRKRLKEMLPDYRGWLGTKARDALTAKLTKIYEGDGLSTIFPGYDRFVRPNISLDFEVVDAIDGSTNTDAGSYGERFLKQIILPKDTSSGLLENKTILRLHIYDEETVMSPAEHTLMSTVTEGTTGDIIGGGAGVADIASKMTFNQAKQYIKRTYPTLIYGSAGSTVRSLGVNANTSGEMANILMVESYGNLKQAQVGGINAESSFESVTLFPNTVSCTLMGMPMIGRGNNIYIDFGTNTSLDNIYTVKNVTHSIRAGDFSTSLELVPSNMGAVQDFAKNISKTFAKPTA